MTKFVIVKEAPESLEKDCVVISAPNFLAEIKKAERKKPNSKTLTPNYLREIIAGIGDKYADENFSALTNVNVSPYKGVACGDDNETNKVLFKIFAASYPKMVDQYVEYYIKSRPFGTKLIYFLGDFTQSSKFSEHGIDQIKEKDVSVCLGLKEKKIVGKPAIKDSEIIDLNANTEVVNNTNNTDTVV